MKNINCCVIDDEPLAANLISSYVKRTPFLELVDVYNSAQEAIKTILDGNVDLVFLDIEMPQLGGMEFAHIIPSDVKVIFTTAYDRYAVQGFRVNAVDYLLKPISYPEFLEAAQRAAALINPSRSSSSDNDLSPQREFIIVKSEYKMIQIRISDILFVESLKDYIKIYVDGQTNPILTLMSMKSIEQCLATDKFLRVHRSFIVNTDRISVIERSQITIGGHVIPISETYRSQFNRYISSLTEE